MKRLNYLKGTYFKKFRSFKEMLEFATDERNDGIYYISYPDITVKKSREQLLEMRK